MENNNTRSTGRTVSLFLLSLLVLYFFPLALVLLDERVLKTYWLAKTFPQGAEWFPILYPFAQ